MKFFRRASAVIVFAAILIPFHSDALAFDSADAYGSHAGYTHAGEVIYVNGDTGEQESIFKNSGATFAGISALDDALYWATSGEDAAVYKFTYATKKKEKILSFSDIGIIEESGRIRQFKMISAHWMYYQVGHPEYQMTFYDKYYNLDEKEAYGLDKVPDTDFGDEQKKYELYLTEPDENIGFGENSVFSFAAVPINKTNVLISAQGGHDGEETQFMQYRLLDLTTKKVRILGDNVSISEEVSFEDGKNGQDYVVGYDYQKNSLEQEQPVTYWRFNLSTGEKENKIYSGSVDDVYGHNSSYVLWNDGDKTYFYDVATNKTCETTAHPTGYITYKRLTADYLFGRVGGDIHNITTTKITCVGGQSESSVPQKGSQKNSQEIAPVDMTDGSLIKSQTLPAVYYLGADNKRYVFPSPSVFHTWYENFSSLQTISAAEMADIPIGGNVTYRPGSTLVKITSDPQVYAVDANGMLRWITGASIATELYGHNWAAKVRDIPDYLFVNYRIGDPIKTVGDFDPLQAQQEASSINADKNLTD